MSETNQSPEVSLATSLAQQPPALTILCCHIFTRAGEGPSYGMMRTWSKLTIRGTMPRHNDCRLCLKPGVRGHRSSNKVKSSTVLSQFQLDVHVICLMSLAPFLKTELFLVAAQLKAITCRVQVDLV